MLPQSYPLDEKIEFSAGSSDSIDLPQSGYITQIDLLYRLQVDTAGTVSANEDGMFRLIKGITVSAGGNIRFFDLTDGRQLYWLNYIKQEGQVSADSLTTTPNQTDQDHYALLSIHFGLDWLNPYDKGVVVPAVRLDNPILRVTWGTESDLGTGYTIDTSNTYIEVTIYELALEPGESEGDRWPRGLVSPRVEPRTLSITETASNLSLEHNVPTGDVLYETLMIVKDSSGDRSDTDVTRVGVKFPKQRRTPWERSWTQIKSATRARYRLPSDVTGVTLLPWEEVTRRAIGIDLKMAQIGDVRLGFNTSTTGGSIDLVHFMYG